MTGSLTEHRAGNRAGKTFGLALFAWESYNQGRPVFCNCPKLSIGVYDCLLNFPHKHLDPPDYYRADLFDCYLMTDEAADPLDARRAMTKARGDLTSFARQVKKREIHWHYDTIRPGDIEPRVRENPDYIIESFRYPKEIFRPLQALRFVITSRYSSVQKTIWITEPWKWYPVYNHWPMSRRPIEREVTA